MKCPENNIEDILRDVVDFLETTLSAEALSPSALEQKHKLLAKVTSIWGRSSKASQESGLGLECYIDMASDPALTSFFGSKAQNSPLGSEPKSLTVSEDMYEPFEDPQSPKGPADHTDLYVNTQRRSCISNNNENRDSDVCYVHTNVAEDNVSLRSAFSEISVLTNVGESSNDVTIVMTAQEALSKNLFSGALKRRSGVKLVSVWRRHFAVLIPNYLLLFANDNDPKPKLVISLDGYEVRTASKVGLDAKRLRLHPFHLVGPGKATHEFAAKTKDELNQWLTALNAAIECCTQQSPTYDVPTSGAAVNSHVVVEVVQVRSEQEPLGRNQDHQSMRARRLPSLPGEENYDDVCAPIAVTPASEPSFSVHIVANNEEKAYEYINPSPIPFDYESEEDLEAKEGEEDIYNSIADDHLRSHGLSYAQSSLRVSPCKSVEKIQPHHVRSRSDGLSDSSMSLRSDPTSVRHSTSSESNRQSNHSVESVTYDTPITSLKPSSARRLWLNREINQNSPQPSTYDIPTSNRPLNESVNVVTTGELYDDVPNPKPVSEVVERNLHKSNVSKIATFIQRKSASDDSKIEKPVTKDITWSKTWSKSVGRTFAAKMRNEPKLITSAGPVVMQALDRLKQCSSNNNLVAPEEGLVKEVVSQSNTPKKGPPRPPGPFMSKSQPNSPSKALVSTVNIKSSTPDVTQHEEVYEEIATATLPSKPVMKVAKNFAKEEGSLGNEWWKTRWAYVAQNANEINVHAGERVMVLSKGAILWKVRVRGKEGLMPKEYLISCAPASPTLTLTLTDDFSNVDV